MSDPIECGVNAPIDRGVPVSLSGVNGVSDESASFGVNWRMAGDIADFANECGDDGADRDERGVE